MATGGTTFVKTQRKRGFTTVLTSAACEWFLIFLLLINAGVSYLMKKYASYCNLQPPCILCSRLDRAKNGEKLKFYHSLLCSNHTSEISSLKSLLLKSSGIDAFKPDIPLPGLSWQSRQEKGSSNSLSNYAGYTDLKLDCDSEFEFTISDDDNAASLICEKTEARNELIRQFSLVVPTECVPSDSNLPQPNSTSPEIEPLVLFPYLEPSISKRHDVNFTGSVALSDYGLSEIIWHQASRKSSKSKLQELNSLNKVSPLPDVRDNPDREPEESKTTRLSQNSLPVTTSGLISSDTRPLVGASPEKSGDDTRASDIGCVSKKHEEGLEKITTRAAESIKTEPHASDSGLSGPRHENLSNVNEFPVTTKGRDIGGFTEVHPTPDEVNGDNEDKRLSPSQNSSPHGSNTSSAVSTNHVDYHEIQTSTSSSNANEELPKSASVESGLESLSNVSEIEGETLVDRLKRQIEQLFKELEEERNAAETAANESMAMITRLQEEKAVLHMEALQYLRMMEEQAEYDGEALDKANDLLAEREKEIQDLESELDFYRLNWEDDLLGQNMHKESTDLKGEHITIQNFSAPPPITLKGENITVQNFSAPPSITLTSSSKMAELSEVGDETVADETSLKFEEDKLYILNCLKGLEKKLGEISREGISFNVSNDRPEIFEESKSDKKKSSNDDGPQLDGQTDNVDLSIKKDFNASNGSPTDQDGSVTSKSDNCSPNKENNHSTSVGQKNSVQSKNSDLVILENEISDLNDRLEALEADHQLLGHIMQSLRNDHDGLQFVREIAQRLHELRNKAKTLQNMA